MVLTKSKDISSQKDIRIRTQVGIRIPKCFAGTISNCQLKITASNVVYKSDDMKQTLLQILRQPYYSTILLYNITDTCASESFTTYDAT